MDVGMLIAIICYFALMLGIGMFFMVKGKKNESEAGYFLGGRKMGPYVTALSAQASDMSGWLLMGLPGSVMALGFGQIWVAIGLAIGTYLNWLLIAGRLRKFSQAAGDSITIPQYLNNRFKAKGKVLQVIAAVIFFVCFTVYVASGYKAGAALFSTVLGIKNEAISMAIFGIILLAYTFMGGFSAVCWTDFFQALLMLGAVIFVPVFVLTSNNLDLSTITATNANYFNFLPSGKFDWASISTIISGLAWGLGYCGMPHILVRFMSIKSSKLIKPSRRVASVWVLITLAMAVFIGVVGAVFTPAPADSEMVFINMVKVTLPGFVAGIFLSAILAAAMSTADSQLLVASSAFTSDIYKPLIKKNANDKEIMWVGRIVVAVIAILAYVIAIIPGMGGIMDLVSNAWAGFGAAFGPVIVLSLFWKRFTYKGAVSGMIAGGLTVILWIALGLNTITGLYELFPGFIVGMAACIIATLLDKPHPEAEEMYEYALNFNEEETIEVQAS
ncbi:MAG: sodium/proline symporter PutP, partial [Clostridia bacterium]|nr:sodium/proline symporter PutP [Clostridia bacterium]